MNCSICKYQVGKMSYKPISKIQTEVDLAKQTDHKDGSCV